MLEEVEVFKVGVTPQALPHPGPPRGQLPTADLQGRAGGGGPQNPQPILVFFQEPAPVKTMTISSKRVSLVTWSGSRDGACAPWGQGLSTGMGQLKRRRTGRAGAQPSRLRMGAVWRRGLTGPSLSPATTVRGLRCGGHTPEPAPLPGVRGRLCRLLPRPGPLLCLGRPGLFPLHRVLQEVWTPRPLEFQPPHPGPCPGGWEVEVMSLRGVCEPWSPGGGDPRGRLPQAASVRALLIQAEPPAGCPAREPHQAVPRLQLQR